MTEAKTKPYAPRVVSEGDIPVHKTLGEVAQTRNVGIPRPMPGIVILVHGVNDVVKLTRIKRKEYLSGWVSDSTGRIFTPTNGKTTELSLPGVPPSSRFTGDINRLRMLTTGRTRSATGRKSGS